MYVPLYIFSIAKPINLIFLIEFLKWDLIWCIAENDQFPIVIGKVMKIWSNFVIIRYIYIGYIMIAANTLYQAKAIKKM